MNKKVLIITYYWPPSGGSGVQRWLKFVKYLPSYQWEPHVFTPENPSFSIQDLSLEKDIPPEAEVIRFPIWEPYHIFFKISAWLGTKKEAKPTSLVSARQKTIFQHISTWIRGNFFIPDPRLFWIKPSVKFLSEYLIDNHITTIITTGPPHSLHIIGLKLKLKYPHLRWLADFRDPWSEWGLLDSLMVSKMAHQFHKRMEKKVLETADEIITITPFYVKQFQHLSNRPVKLLTNGFDEEDFKGIVYAKTDKFIIRHVGIVNEKCDPTPFMNALKIEMEDHKDFARDVQVEFIGEVHPHFSSYVDKIDVLRAVTRFPGNISHQELMAMYGSSSLLLMILTGYKDAAGFLPGKLFEYCATGLPILGVGPIDGDAASFLKETGAGVMLESHDSNGLRKVLQKCYQNWHAGQKPSVISAQAHGFSRKNITGKLVEILNFG